MKVEIVLLGNEGTQFHVLDAPMEELQQLLAADPRHAAGHHGLDGGL